MEPKGKRRKVRDEQRDNVRKGTDGEKEGQGNKEEGAAGEESGWWVCWHASCEP
jgi:hypothetical protein